MSRICVKGLAKEVDEKELRELFARKGEVTDVRVIRTKSQVSRRFAFVGFRTPAEAQTAISYFNQTYLRTCKISVELAAKYESSEDISAETLTKLSSSKSKHTKNKLEKILSTRNKAVTVGKDTTEKPVKQTKFNDRKPKELEEFLNLMKSRATSKAWSNDEVNPIASSLDGNHTKTDPGLSDSDSTDVNSEVDSDNDINDVIQDPLTSSEVSTPMDVTPAKLSDMDFLKSKIKSNFDEDENLKSNPDVSKKTISFSKVDEKSNSHSVINTEEPNNTSSPDAQREDLDDTGRLFIRNLPFSTGEDDLKSVFESFGPITEIHIPLDNEKKGKGYGFVQFMFPENAMKAMRDLDGSSFQGRLLHVIQAETPREIVSPTKDTNSRLSSFQKKKEEERRKQLNKKDGWNASFVRSDAVVESLAERYGLKSSDILDTSLDAGEIAVRMALGETQIIQENRAYFASHGVNINVLESGHSESKSSARSTTSLLVKNLPSDMVVDELESMFSKFGTIASFLVPNSKTIAVVDFVEPSEARIAFKALAYRRYHKQPLYLEWAPVGLIDKEKASAAHSKQKVISNTNDATTAVNNTLDEDSSNDYSTLFLKNLSFGTSEEELRSFCIKLGIEGIRTTSIPMKPKADGSSMVAMGYGFIEFKNSRFAENAQRKLDKAVLDGHALEVKPSTKRISAVKPVTAGSKSAVTDRNTKLVIRNVPFQATQSEIRGLFSTYGSVKSLRVPKKMAGEHRGFAFIEFTTHQEALSAFNALGSTHLYGRHLVLEWAKDEDGDLDVLRKRAQDQEKVLRSSSKRTKLDDYEGIDSGFGLESKGKIGIGGKNDDDDIE